MKSWKNNNTLNKYEEKFSSLEIIENLENRVKEAIKNNADILAEIFCEDVADYLWDNYDMEDWDIINLDNIVNLWFKNKFKKK